MIKVTMLKAKTHLSQLVADAEAGEEVVIMRDTVPVVRLVPVAQPVPVRTFGALAGKIRVTAAFFQPLDESDLSAWNA